VSSTDDGPSGYTRRRFLTLSIASGASASLLLSHNSAEGDKPPPSEPTTYNGSTDPYPIPWLDKNGSHNQPAGPQLEPSHIYHFKGESPDAPISPAWALTIKVTELPLAPPQPTTDLCRENTSRDALRRRERSLTYD
jgi:hypothetical protein